MSECVTLFPLKSESNKDPKMGNTPPRDWKAYLTPTTLAASLLTAIPMVQSVRENQVRQEVQMEHIRDEQKRIIEEQQKIRGKIDELIQLLQTKKIVWQAQADSFAGERSTERRP